MTSVPGKPRFRDVQRRFDRAAAGFDDADYLHRHCFDGLVERLGPVRIEPSLIVDLGSATGTGSRRLAKSFRRSRVVGVDASAGMLVEARRRRSVLSRVRDVQADAARLPLRDRSVDLAIANLLLPWVADAGTVVHEVARVLKPGGVFAFATLGVGSLANLRQAWRHIDEFAHVGEFPDMHDIGDALVRAGLAEPVLDVERLTVTFDDLDRFLRDLAAAGAGNCLAGRRPGLSGRGWRPTLERQLARTGDGPRYSFELELVFGHAFGPVPRPPAGEFRVAPGDIGRRRGQ